MGLGVEVGLTGSWVAGAGYGLLELGGWSWVVGAGFGSLELSAEYGDPRCMAAGRYTVMATVLWCRPPFGRGVAGSDHFRRLHEISGPR